MKARWKPLMCSGDFFLSSDKLRDNSCELKLAKLQNCSIPQEFTSVLWFKGFMQLAQAFGSWRSEFHEVYKFMNLVPLDQFLPL